MPLEDQYPADFLRLYEVYPKFPAGRTVKQKAYEKYKIAKRECRFNSDDIEAIRAYIIRRAETGATWQENHEYKPPGMQKFFHQRLWNQEYETVRAAKKRTQSHSTYDPTPAWKEYGYDSELAYRAAQEAKGPQISEMLGKLRRQLH